MPNARVTAEPPVLVDELEDWPTMKITAEPMASMRITIVAMK